jgi:hypothetical protein
MLIDQMHPDPGWNAVCWWRRVGLSSATTPARTERVMRLVGRPVPRQFWAEAGGAALTAALLVLTLIARDWIELVFGVDPDRGDGSLEVTLVVMAAIATCVLALLARRDWRRAQPATRRPV